VATISPYRRARVIATGQDAAAKLRREIQREGWAHCANCPAVVLPSAVDVDHILPLSKGGTDTPGNVQVLCRPCHKAKTRDDMGYSAPPF
jgi:5-methylcytosine-specific restriction protein A